MARFMHIADCHVGCRQYGLREREEDFYKALYRAADAAVENKVDAVVIAGDLFDSAKPSAEAVKLVQGAVKHLNENRIRVLGIEGNHDMAGDNWLAVCGIEPLDWRVVDVGGVKVAGFDYRRSDVLVQDLDSFSSEEDSKADMVVLHTGFAEMGDSFGSDLSVQSVLPFLQRMGTRCVALGHIHIPMEPIYGGIHFVQPGSLEMKDVSETQDKQAVLVEIDGGTVRQRPVPIPTRPFRSVTVNSEEDLHDLLENAKSFAGEFIVVHVSNAVDSGSKRIYESLSHQGCLFRVSVFDAGTGVGSAGPEYEREKAMPTLAAAVDAFFDEDDERHRLVTEILKTPDNLRGIVEEFMKTA